MMGHLGVQHACASPAEAVLLAETALLAVAALVVLCQLVTSQPATDAEEEWVQATDPDGSSHTVRYLLQDKTGKGLAALQNAWSFEEHSACPSHTPVKRAF